MGAHNMSPISKLASIIEAHRESTRIPIHARARIRTDAGIIEGEVENLSINGAYVTSDKHVEINSSVEIIIFDDSTTSQAVFGIKAKVVWVKDHKIGLQFA
jgi:hypothetical protein